MASRLLVLALLFVSCSLALAANHRPLQDFCVADLTSPEKVNRLACKDGKIVQAGDFFFGGLHLMGNTSNVVGSRETPITVAQLLGLNTLGISLAQIDYASWGINPPHTHPWDTEILTVLEGALEVGSLPPTPKSIYLKITSQG